MSGLATRAVSQREFHVFGNAHFERLAEISASHICNPRASRTCRTQRAVVAGTKASAVSVGVRRNPAACRACGASTPNTRGLRPRRRRHGDLRALPRGAARSPARPVPVRRCRLPRGQRFGLRTRRVRARQPYRCRADQQSARPGLHQVPTVGQRPRRGQECQPRAPVPRSGPSTPAATGCSTASPGPRPPSPDGTSSSGPTPRLAPPDHRRLIERGDRDRGQPVENATRRDRPLRASAANPRRLLRVSKANHPRRRRSKGSSSYCNMLSSNCPTPSGGETGVRRIIR